MASIKPLPEAVRSSVRSGIILFDLTRVVEELVFNSLDAGASKVLVFVGVGTNYVKVVDDGFGISRDGLVSLGERYVTSKVKQPIDSDAGGGSFGFKGEALACISDVALLEIVTKAQGKPNGYRKVIKGSKCLYLGIDDERREVGTTVVVRDLFYNQPVRRKHIQASPKKFLLSVKQCLLRIALVHPNVSFSIIDIESEDELLCTKPSSSPMPLLMGGFGIEDVSSFHKVNSDDGGMKLSGYISGPCDNVATKIFQYVYVNSRFVCSGSIHKLLNNLAASFDCLDPSKANRYQKGKRVRSQGYPAYILNISCPPASYDITFEPSKTHVEFKDWKCILTFVEKTILHIWNNTLNHANRFGKNETLKEYGNMSPVAKDVDEGVSLGKKFIIKKCRTQNHQPSFDFPSTHDQIPFEELNKNSERFKEVDCSFRSWNTEQLEEADCSFQSWEGPLVKCSGSVTKNSDDLSGISDDNLLPSDDYLGNRFATSAGSKRLAESKGISSKIGYESLDFENDMINNERVGFHHEFSSEWLFRKNSRKPLRRTCSSRESLPFDEDFFGSKIGVESPIISFRTKRKRIGSSDEFGNMELDLTNQTFDCFSKNVRHDEAAYCQTPPRHEINDEVPSGFNFLTRTSPQRFHSYGDSYSEDYSFLSDSDVQLENSGSRFQSFSTEWCSVSPGPFEHFSCKTLEGHVRSYERDHSRHSLDIEEKKSLSSFDGMSSPIKENLTFGIENAEEETKNHNDVDMDFCKFMQEYDRDDKFSTRRSDVQFEQKNHSPSGKDYNSINECENQRDQFRYRDSKQKPVPGQRFRSKSAPPFCRLKSRFISLSNCLQKAAEAVDRSNLVEVRDELSSPDTGRLKHSQPSPVLSFKKHFEEDRENINYVPETIFNPKAVKKDENFKHSLNLESLENVSAREIVSNRHQDSVSSATKWRVGSAQITNNKSSEIQNQDSVLDISSGFQNLATDSLVPESINKSCLENAKILQQVDKKFIPIVAGGTLAVIDQHAADERIRLEELRQKVLSGEAKTVTYLDSEQELIMPEIGFQLLHNYAEQIKCWGWICNIHAEDSRSFKRNLSLLHQQPAVITLIAVPCILGVNLSDVDLLEFLQQLADTDGSSIMPPSVNRILNSKACRGAIMFGDSLLPSECSLIVQELKQTSLCFQCAHGRPTTVPLLNLEVLHKQIAKLEAMSSSPSKSWHGLCRHEFSIERASKRLSSS